MWREALCKEALAVLCVTVGCLSLLWPGRPERRLGGRRERMGRERSPLSRAGGGTALSPVFSLSLMGAYLSSPVTEKRVEEGDALLPAGRVAYGVVAMQGWRRTMEDAHTVSICEQHGLFGVFDGHGGR